MNIWKKNAAFLLPKGIAYIEAVLANEHEAALLGIERGAPLLMLDSVSFSEHGQPIEYYHALHRGDRSRFEVELFRVHEINQRSVEPEANFTEHQRSPHDKGFHGSNFE